MTDLSAQLSSQVWAIHEPALDNVTAECDTDGLAKRCQRWIKSYVRTTEAEDSGLSNEVLAFRFEDIAEACDALVNAAIAHEMSPRTQRVAGWAAHIRDDILDQFEEMEIPLLAFAGRDLWGMADGKKK